MLLLGNGGIVGSNGGAFWLQGKRDGAMVDVCVCCNGPNVVRVMLPVIVIVIQVRERDY